MCEDLAQIRPQAMVDPVKVVFYRFIGFHRRLATFISLFSLIPLS